MPLLEFLTPEAVVPAMRSRQEAGAARARRACGALTGLDERAVFDTLLQRERLGSTGIGEGIAIPHGKPAYSRTCSPSRRGSTSRSISRPLDGQPVDILFLLLAPEGPAPTISRRSPASRGAARARHARPHPQDPRRRRALRRAEPDERATGSLTVKWIARKLLITF